MFSPHPTNMPLSVKPEPQDAICWLPRHEEKLAEKNAMGRVDLVFLGDSITQAWEKEGADMWQTFYGSRCALGHRMDKAKETALGVKRILEQLAERLPHTKILLLAIFPRSAKPTQKLRVLNDEVNQIIQTYADDKMVYFLRGRHS